MSYIRVIPRDLFNEANLLKCYGQLVINLEVAGEHVAFLDEPPTIWSFRIDMDPSSGDLTIGNLPFSIGGRPYRLMRRLNSRRPWPLYAETDDEATSVFNDDGGFSDEFRALIRGPA